MRFKKAILNIILIGTCGISGYAQNLEKVTLQLKWKHQFQFAGYYAAIEQGYYKEAGLDVKVVEASGNHNPIDQVLTGKADFGIGASDLILLREKGVPVVVLSSIFQHSPLVLLSLKKEGIQSIHDLVGETVMIEEGSAELFAYLKNEGIDISDFKVLPHSFGVSDLVRGKVKAMSAYITTEAFMLQELGVEYIVYSPRAAGIDFYSDNLFTTEKLIEEKPEIVEKFRLASLKGWNYAIHNQDEVIQLIKNKYGSELSVEGLSFEAQQITQLMQANLIEIGYANPKRWIQIMNIYKEMGMDNSEIDLSEFIYDPNPKSNYERFYLIITITLSLLLLAIFIAIRFIRLSQTLKSTIKVLNSTQKALNMSESKYKLLIENNESIIFSLNTEGTFTFASSVLTDKLGYQIHEILGQNFQFLIHPDDVALCLSMFHKSLFYGEPQTALEYRVTNKQGEWFWNTVSLAPLKDENGVITQLVGTASDITEYKLAQIALQESEAKHRMLSDLSGDMIVMHRNFEKYYVNPAVEKILGYSQEEFLTIGLLDLVYPDDKEFVRRSVNSDCTDFCEKNYNSDFRLRHKEGHYIAFSAHIIVHQLAANSFITVINLRNITDKVQNEREIRKLSTAVNQSPATIVITSIEGEIEYVNPHFTAITGYTYEEAVGQNPRILQSHHHSKEFYQEMWETLKRGDVWRGEIYNKRKDGTCYWEGAVMAPVVDEKGEIINYVAIKTDITKRKEIEQNNREQNEQLINLNETKDRFISILAHDLRNPFHSLMGLSEVLAQTIPPDQTTVLELSEAIKNTATNTFNLLENILEWAHAQKHVLTPKRQNCNLLEIVTECTTLMHQQAESKGISFKIMIDNDLIVKADGEMLKTILRNLIVNAVKFSRSGDSVSISAHSSDSKINISVSDTGIGMVPETVATLFKLGHTYTTQGTAGEKGTGFGLLICKELIDKNYGEINVASVLGKGTTFTISLPN